MNELSDESFAEWRRVTGDDELSQILYWCWDPIEVNNVFPNSAREYDDYVPALLARLRRGADAQDVIAFLQAVEQDQMGLGTASLGADHGIGTRITYWFAESTRWWIEDPRRRA